MWKASCLLIVLVRSSYAQYVLSIKADEGQPWTCPDNGTSTATCECRHTEECNAAPSTKTLVCRNAGDCNCGGVDRCICENVGDCACENAKSCHCSNIGQCWHKPESKAHLWECPNLDAPGELVDEEMFAPVWKTVSVVKHRCTNKPCPNIFICSSGECVLEEVETETEMGPGYVCNQQTALMQEMNSSTGRNLCEVCVGARADKRYGEKRCHPDCMAASPASPTASLSWSIVLASVVAAYSLQ